MEKPNRAPKAGGTSRLKSLLQDWGDTGFKLATHYQCPWTKTHLLFLLRARRTGKRVRAAAGKRLEHSGVNRLCLTGEDSSPSAFHCFLSREKWEPTVLPSTPSARLASMSSSLASSFAFPPAVIPSGRRTERKA